MLDIAAEKPITLSQAAKACPIRPHISTIWRWAEKGVKGILLETITIGGRRYTSREAIARFIAATTAASSATSSQPTRTPQQRQRDIDRAKAELTQAGI